jgi:DNA-binding transcriptional ArsR family regulator
MVETTDKNDINEVLKALNHDIRRKIIRILHKNRSAIAYSDFLQELMLPASSNAAYHLVLLTKTNLIAKDDAGKYFLTELGERAALLLDIAVEPKSDAFTNLYLGFSRLTPLEILVGAWWLFFLLMGIILSQMNFLVAIFSLSFAIFSLGYLVYKTRTPWSLLLISNLIWIFFAPEKRQLLFSISVSNLIGLFILFPELEALQSYPVQFVVIGSALLVLSFILSVWYIYLVRLEINQ